MWFKWNQYVPICSHMAANCDFNVFWVWFIKSVMFHKTKSLSLHPFLWLRKSFTQQFTTKRDAVSLAILSDVTNVNLSFFCLVTYWSQYGPHQCIFNKEQHHSHQPTNRNANGRNRQQQTSEDTDRPSLRNFDRVYLISIVCFFKIKQVNIMQAQTLKVPRQHANYKAKACQR